MDARASVLHGGDMVECWDDDPDFADLDNIQQHSSSPTYSRASTEHHRRESVSSRLSLQSAYDGDSPDSHEHHVPLDESPTAAIASAISAGIPIPENVPSSALIGGTIKRLGTSRKGRKVTAHDDWSDDLELPSMGNILTVKKQEFPESLHQISTGKRSRASSPSRANLAPVHTASSQLNKFRDTPEDDDFLAGDSDLPAVLKLSPVKRTVQSSKSLLLTPPLSSATKGSPSGDDDFENDFEFPADASMAFNLKSGQTTRAPVRDLDTELDIWGDTDAVVPEHREKRQNEETRKDQQRNSGISIVSPAMSGMNLESEDEGFLDGLILPDGAFPDIHAILAQRREATKTPSDTGMDYQVQKDTQDVKEEFFDGIEIGEGEVFDTQKLTLNRNVKHKQSNRRPSPVRRTATSLTFTSRKSATNQSIRANRLSQGHPTLLPPIPILEPVAEREPPSTARKRPETRTRRSLGPMDRTDRWSIGDAIGVHIPPPPPIPQSRNDRQNLGSKSSLRTVRQENTQPTTTSAQLLRAKRSMPNIGKVAQGVQSPPKAGRPTSRSSGGRPPSSSSAGRPTSSSSRPTSSGSRPTSSSSRPPSSTGRPASRTSSGRPGSRNELQARPKTPHGNVSVYKHPAPFLPAGSSAQNSHHVAAKSVRDSRELDRRPTSRFQQRTTPRQSPSSSGAIGANKRGTPTVAPEHLRREAATMGTLTQPTRKRNFGDGTELETFDDLPTSAKIERRYTVTPVARGAPKIAGHTRTKSAFVGESPRKRGDIGSRFGGELPRFARDTNASRHAREETQLRLSMTSPVSSPNSTSQWRAQVAARSQATPRHRKKTHQKPQLIKPLGNISNLPKTTSSNGMVYNPRAFRWEGNEKDLRHFDTNDNITPPRPALIANVNHSGLKFGIQVVGGMVFDPSQMCWLKVQEDPEDEGDPFEGLEDLVDADTMSIDGQSVSGAAANNTILVGGLNGLQANARVSAGFSGEFVVGEEFDVGPEFVRRQREEESLWKKNVEGWISTEIACRPGNRYELRELLWEHHRR